MARVRFTEHDFNRDEVSEEVREFLAPDQRGDDGEDDPADVSDPEGHERDWRDYNVARAASPFTFGNTQWLLRTGGRLSTSAIDRYDD